METYIIIAIAFAIIFAIRYIKDIMLNVQDIVRIHEVDARNNLLYSIGVMLFLFSIIFMPFYAIVILSSDRHQLNKHWAKLILLKYYQMEVKN